MRRLYTATTLPDGQRVRLRLPHRFDGAPLRALHQRLGLEADDLLLGRVIRFDPRERVAVVATLLAGHSENIVGLAVMDRHAGDADLVLADEEQAPGVGAFLEAALRTHTQSARRIA
ncbi:MAG: hypothetical protein QOG68_1129 [Solirubrobacteraceae bacterium]|nr:hypothetical protein [Solirubrobacteraceae bacterium]